MADDPRREEHFKQKFPEKFLCLMCDDHTELDRDKIPEHLQWTHDWNDVTWESIYKRLSAVGVI